MAYKDKDKQREANRERQRRYKAKQKALPSEGVTTYIGAVPVTPDTEAVIPKCWCCGDTIQAGLVCCGPCAWSGKAKAKREGQEALLAAVIGPPPDDDYVGVCTA